MYQHFYWVYTQNPVLKANRTLTSPNFLLSSWCRNLSMILTTRKL